MQAVVFTGVGQPLVCRERPELEPREGQAIVELRAAALNRRDYFITKGLYPGIKTPVVLGSDGSGIVARVGRGVAESWLGREVILYPGIDWGDSPAAQSRAFRVLGMPDDGTFATSVAVPANLLFAKPPHLSWQEAAALPLAGVTAYRAVCVQGMPPGSLRMGQKMGQAPGIHAPEPVPFSEAPGIHAPEPVPFSEAPGVQSRKMGQAPGIHAPEPVPFSQAPGIHAPEPVPFSEQTLTNQRVLITGIGGGVAVFALQFALAAGAEVWVTSSSPRKIQHAVSLGAKGGFDYRHAGWHRELVKLSGPIDLIIDSAGGSGYADLIEAAAPGGRIVTYGATAGRPPEVDLFKVFWKQLHLIGSTLGSPRDFEAMLDQINRHRIRPVVDQAFPLDDAPLAIARMADSPQFGKLVLNCGI
jgi:NADPH:quinone reductase-like Zn-dependent oxidoreductase